MPCGADFLGGANSAESSVSVPTVAVVRWADRRSAGLAAEVSQVHSIAAENST